MRSLAGDPQSPVGRYFIGKNVVIMAVTGVASVVLAIWALATGASDPGILLMIVAMCTVGVVLGLRFLRR